MIGPVTLVPPHYPNTLSRYLQWKGAIVDGVVPSLQSDQFCNLPCALKSATSRCSVAVK